MKNASDVERDENVIQISFGNEIPNEISHPESLRYPEEIDDPLAELLNEYNDVVEEDLPKEDFIFAHEDKWRFSVSTLETTQEMADTILKQSRRIREDVKRLKYYLDEMNID